MNVLLKMKRERSGYVGCVNCLNDQDNEADFPSFSTATSHVMALLPYISADEVISTCGLVSDPSQESFDDDARCENYMVQICRAFAWVSASD